MDDRLLDTFLDLVETRSFNRTAERMGISQSTVSARLKSLEAGLGRQLFTRSKAGAAPTRAGIEFTDHARALRQRWAEARRGVLAAGVYEREMRVGMQRDLGAHLLRPAVGQIRARLPGTAIYMEVDFSQQMVRDLSDGELDVAVLYSPITHPDLFFEQIGAMEYVMVSTKERNLDQVSPLSYVRAAISPNFEHMHAATLPQLSASPVGCGQAEAVRQLLLGMDGAGYVSAPLAADMELAGEAFRVEGAPAFSQPVYAGLVVRQRHAVPHRAIVRVFRRLFQKGKVA